MMGSAALATVQTGWTGTITAGGITVTPRTRESVASLIARLTVEAYAQAGLTLTWSCSSSGVLSVVGDATFTLSATNNTATRTGFTGTYTGTTTYTAAGAYSGAYVPTAGLRLGEPGQLVERGSVVGDGTLAYAGPSVSQRTTLSVWSSYADTWDAEDAITGVQDVWHDGRVFGRVLVEEVRRVPLGRLRSGTMRLDVECAGVAE